LLGLALLENSSSLLHLALEVLLIREQLLVVHCALIENHASDGWRFGFAVSFQNRTVDVVTHEVLSVFTSQVIKRSWVNVGKFKLGSLVDLHTLSHVLLHHLILSLRVGSLALRLVAASLTLMLVASSLTAALAVATSASWIHVASLAVVSSAVALVALLVAVVALMSLVVSTLVAAKVLLLMMRHHSLRSAHWLLLHRGTSLVAHVVVLLALARSNQVDDGLDGVLGLLLALLLQVVLSLPEVNLERLVVVAEGLLAVKESNSFLSGLDVIEEDVSNLVGLETAAVDLAFGVVASHLDGANSAGFGELGLKLFSSDLVGNKANEDVTSEELLLVLDDGVRVAGRGLQIRLLLVDVRLDENSLSAKLHLHVDGVHCLLGVLMTLEVDVAVARLRSQVNTDDLTVALEQVSQLILSEVMRQVLQEEVCESVALHALAVLSLGVDEHANLLSVDVLAVQLLDGLLSSISAVELDIAKASRLTRWVDFEFT